MAFFASYEDCLQLTLMVEIIHSFRSTAVFIHMQVDFSYWQSGSSIAVISTMASYLIRGIQYDYSEETLRAQAALPQAHDCCTDATDKANHRHTDQCQA